MDGGGNITREWFEPNPNGVPRFGDGGGGKTKSENIGKIDPPKGLKPILPKDIAPFEGVWGKLDYYLNGGIVKGQQYDIDGKWIGKAPLTGVAPTPDGFKSGINTIYKGVKFVEKEGKFLPYIGKSFNIFKRYSKAERDLLKIVPVLNGIKDPMLLRAIEQRIIEFTRTLGPTANIRNAFSPRHRDYQKYMMMADKWLKENAPDFMDLFK